MTHKYNVRDTITMCNTPRTGSVAEGGGDYRALPEVEPTGSSVKGAHLLHTHVQYRIRSGRWGKLPGSSRGGTHWKLGEGSLQAERDEVPRGTHFNPSCKPSGTKSLEAHISIVSLHTSVLFSHKRHNADNITAEVGDATGLVPRRNPWKPYIHAYHVIICISKSSIDSGA